MIVTIGFGSAIGFCFFRRKVFRFWVFLLGARNTCNMFLSRFVLNKIFFLSYFMGREFVGRLVVVFFLRSFSE